ncbi:MAG TPA: DUF6790 family protein [Legionellaceae bacterium]|nr:DUF6790 family protein [Legionellaceae bacterium]
MWFLLLWALGLIASFVYFLISGFPREIHQMAHILLLGQFVVTFGLVAVIGMVTNVFFAETTAKQLKWPGGPFQIKYGFAQLCLGVMGVMAFWFHGNFWAATIVNMYMYGLSGYWTHTQEMLKNKKPDASNVCNLIMNTCYQLFLTILSIWAGDVWVI